MIFFNKQLIYSKSNVILIPVQDAVEELNIEDRDNNWEAG